MYSSLQSMNKMSRILNLEQQKDEASSYYYNDLYSIDIKNLKSSC